MFDIVYSIRRMLLLACDDDMSCTTHNSLDDVTFQISEAAMNDISN